MPNHDGPSIRCSNKLTIELLHGDKNMFMDHGKARSTLLKSHQLKGHGIGRDVQYLPHLCHNHFPCAIKLIVVAAKRKQKKGRLADATFGITCNDIY
jgi:hypothetical protein